MILIQDTFITIKYKHNRTQVEKWQKLNENNVLNKYIAYV